MNDRGFREISEKGGNFITVINTNWIYPMKDIQKALSTTEFKYTFDGRNIVSPDMSNLNGVYNSIFTQTSLSQPLGNQGFSLGVGTVLKDLGDEIFFQLANGEIVIKWRLVQQLSPQTNPPLPSPGNSPQNTIGYLTVFSIFPYGATPNFFDNCLSVRSG